MSFQPESYAYSSWTAGDGWRWTYRLARWESLGHFSEHVVDNFLGALGTLYIHTKSYCNYPINDHFIWGSVLPTHEVIYRYEATLRHLGPSRWLLLPSKSMMIHPNQVPQKAVSKQCCMEWLCFCWRLEFASLTVWSVVLGDVWCPCRYTYFTLLHRSPRVPLFPIKLAGFTNQPLTSTRSFDSLFT